MAVQLLRRRFTVSEYHRMGETGILSEDDRLELLEGEIVETDSGTPDPKHYLEMPLSTYLSPPLNPNKE